MPDDETTQMQVELDEALAQRDAVRGRIRLMVRSEAAGSDLLADDKIKLLRRALAEWGGPAHCSDHLAVGMGFADQRDLLDQCDRLRNALADDVPLTQVDWACVLLATEIVFVSDLMGPGSNGPPPRASATSRPSGLSLSSADQTRGVVR